jgi:hypothetical protein
MPKTKTSRAAIMVATDTGAIDVDGVPYFVYRNRTRVRADHPMVKNAPGLFKPVDADYDDVVEQATAAPGERRGAA